jgi:hypothetical protein
MEAVENSVSRQSVFLGQSQGRNSFSIHLFALPQMAFAESLAFGRGVTRKLQGFGGNRNIPGARR